MSQARLRSALEQRLYAWKDTTYPLLKIYAENKKSPTTDDLYITTTLFPDSVLDPSIGNVHKRYTGRWRVVLMHNMLGKGVGATEAIAESLANWFGRGTTMVQAGQTVNIERTPSLRATFVDGNYLVIPVDIFYRSDVII